MRGSIFILLILLSGFGFAQGPDYISADSEKASLNGEPYTGETVGYFPKDSLISISKYKNGKRVERVNYYFTGSPTLQIRSHLTYNLEEKSSSFIKYYPNGQIKSQTFDGPSGIHGKHMWWFSDGTVMSEGDFVDGNGFMIDYYKDGSLKSKVEIRNGFEAGYIAHYCENGTLITSGYNQQGLQNWIVYHCNGKLQIEAQYIDLPNFCVGKYKEYYENGKKKVIGQYQGAKDENKAGIKTGKWKYYDERGKLLRVEVYVDGVLQGK